MTETIHSIIPADGWYAVYFGHEPPYFDLRKVAAWALLDAGVSGLVPSEWDERIAPATDFGGLHRFWYGDPNNVPLPLADMWSDAGRAWSEASLQAISPDGKQLATSGPAGRVINFHRMLMERYQARVKEFPL